MPRIWTVNDAIARLVSSLRASAVRLAGCTDIHLHARARIATIFIPADERVVADPSRTVDGPR